MKNTIWKTAFMAFTVLLVFASLAKATDYYKSSDNQCGFTISSDDICTLNISQPGYCGPGYFYPTQICSDSPTHTGCIAETNVTSCDVCGDCVAFEDTCQAMACGTTNSYGCETGKVCSGQNVGAGECATPDNGNTCYCDAMCTGGATCQDGICTEGSYDISDCSTLDVGGATYNLTAPISYVGEGTGFCFEVLADNITLDCQGNLVNGNGLITDGLLATGVNNVTIQNCTFANFTTGIDLITVDDWHFSNVEASNNSDGFYLNEITNSDFNGITAINNILFTSGIDLINSNGNVFNDVNASYNDIGIYLRNSSFNDFTDVYAVNNNESGGPMSGIDLTAGSNSNTFTNVVADNNSPYGILVDTSDNNTFSNFSASFNYALGISMYEAHDNNFTDGTLDSNGYWGIYMEDSTYNSFKDMLLANSVGGAFLQYSDDNTFDNITTQFCGVGIEINNCGYFTIKNSRIQDSAWYGIYLRGAGDIGENNFFNNFLNNSVQVYFDPGDNIYPNFWNTTNQSGTRIIGLGNIGGNYWVGYSDVCADSNGDEFCDRPYDVLNNAGCTPGFDCSDNTDFLPLTGLGGSPFNITDCATLGISGGSYLLTANIVNSSAYPVCIDIAASNIDLNCQGHTVDGDGATGYIGIGIIRNGTCSGTISSCSEIDDLICGGIPDCCAYFGCDYNGSACNGTTLMPCYSPPFWDGCSMGFSECSAMENTNISIHNCVVTDWTQAGIALDSVSHNKIYNNSILNNDNDGIALDSTTDNEIYRNWLAGNGYGISLYGNLTVNNLIYNNYLDNGQNAWFDEDVQNSWNTTIHSGTRIYTYGNQIGGNYWKGYSDTCVDADRNRFCDVPYDALNDTGCTANCSGNVDYLPLTVAPPLAPGALGGLSCTVVQLTTIFASLAVVILMVWLVFYTEAGAGSLLVVIPMLVALIIVIMNLIGNVC